MNAEAGPSYSNRYTRMQPSGSGMHHMGTSTGDSPIDVDLQEGGSDNSGEPLHLDADPQEGGDLDLEGDEMDEDQASERGTPPDHSDFTAASMGPGQGQRGSHSQGKYHPH